jgi:hypothetical protein
LSSFLSSEKGKPVSSLKPLRTYGKVYKARVKDSGKIVAIKKFKESDEEDQHVSYSIRRISGII